MPGSPLSTTPRRPELRTSASSSANAPSSFARPTKRASCANALGSGTVNASVGARTGESESGSVSVSMPSQLVATRRSIRTTSGEGSVPSSSMSSDRYCWNARSASAWRPALARARIKSPRELSRYGCRGDLGFEHRDHVCRPARRDQLFGVIIDRTGMHLRQPSDLGVSPFLSRELLERGAGPQRERALQASHPVGGVGGAGDRLGKLVHVDVSQQRVARARRLQRVSADGRSQPGDRHPQRRRARCPRCRRATPSAADAASGAPGSRAGAAGSHWAGRSPSRQPRPCVHRPASTHS